MTETVVTVENAPNNNAAKPNDGGGLAWLKFNVEYFKTLPGIIKIIELVLGIICMSLASPAYLSGTHWFLFAVTISFLSTLIWSFVYLLGIREALNLPIDWLLSEMGNTALNTVFYLLAFIVQISIWSTTAYHHNSRNPKPANLVAGGFATVNTFVYGFGTVLLYKEWKRSKIASVNFFLANYVSLLVLDQNYLWNYSNGVWPRPFMSESFGVGIRIEMVNTGIDTVLYCIGFIVQLAVWVSPYRGPRVPNLIAGVFGIFNTIAYGYGTLMLHKEWKSSRTTN